MGRRYDRRMAEVEAAMEAWTKAHTEGLFEEIGWSGGIMGQWIEYRGQPPRGTGNDQSNLGMIRAIEKMEREEVAKALHTQGALTRAMMEARKPVQLLMLRYLRGGTKAQRADEMGLSIKAYSRLIDCAMELMVIELRQNSRRVA